MCGVLIMKNRKKPILALDCDGVLADFTTTTLDLLNKFKGSNHLKSEITEWDFFTQFLDEYERKEFRKTFNSHRLFSILEPYKEAQDAFEELKNRAKIYIVTSPMREYDTWVKDRDEWLKTHFGIKDEMIIHTRAKHRVHANVFVEDKPSTLKAWCKQWPEESGVLWKHSGNMKEGTNFKYHSNDWNDVISLLK